MAGTRAQGRGDLPAEKVVVGYAKDKPEGGYPAGSIIMDSPHHMTAGELLALAQDREAWKLHVKKIVE